MRTDSAYKTPVLSLVLLLGITALYLPAIPNAFLFDDHEVIVEQEAPRSLGDLVGVFGERSIVGLPYYRPMTRVTFLVQKALHGDAPAPFHVANALLIGLIAVLAYTLLRLPVFGVDRAPAALMAALFAAHPVASSCVYPISSGRETALPTLWMLAATYAWLRTGTGWRIAAVLALAGALLTKEQAAVLPVLFVVADALGLTRFERRSVRSWALRYAPVAACVVAYAVIRAQLFGGSELAVGSALGPVRSFGFALQTLAAPTVPLVYEPELSTWFSAPRLLFALFATSITVVLAFRTRRAASRALGFWLAWFLIVPLPTANLLAQEAPFDERYLFAASLGAWAVWAMIGTALESRARTAWLVAATAAVVLAAGVTAGRAQYFRDDATFFAQWYRTAPDSADANTQLGKLRYAERRYADALPLLERALELGAGHSEAWVALGATRRALGDPDGARLAYETALALEPEHADAHFRVGVLEAAEGNRADAIALYRKAVRLKPNHAPAHYNLGTLHLQAGELREAIASLERALAYRPDFAPARYNLGNALARSGELERAVVHFQRAVELEPENERYRNNLQRARAAVP